MTLQERLNADLKEAMKSGDKSRVAVLRMTKAAIKNAEIAKGGALDDSGTLEVISKEVKKRRDSIAEFKRANRQEMVAQEEAEIDVVLEYLPQQMTEQEIESAARAVIEETGAQGPHDKGKVMSKLMPQLKGKADGQLINQTVTRLLGGP